MIYIVRYKNEPLTFTVFEDEIHLYKDDDSYIIVEQIKEQHDEGYGEE